MNKYVNTRDLVPIQPGLCGILWGIQIVVFLMEMLYFFQHVVYREVEESGRNHTIMKKIYIYENTPM